MLILGEVRTCLLHNTTPLPAAMAAQILELVPGRRVRSDVRPVARSFSPELLTGIDCKLATSSRTRARGIGTVGSRAVITSGLVLQGSATAVLKRAAGSGRLPWQHYAGNPGVVEVISKADPADLAAGYLSDVPGTTTLDLGSVSERTIGGVQWHPQLDHVTAVRSRPTWVRWAARLGDPDSPSPRARVRFEDDSLRTIELTLGEDQLAHAARFCEDFALHDWLLSALGQVIEQADRLRALGREPIGILRTAVERLLHLWMPGAQVNPALAPLWDALERHPGFSLQWQAQVAHIRDQVALRTLQALEQARPGNAGW